VADIRFHTINFCLNNIPICILFYFYLLFGILLSLWKPVWISSDLHCWTWHRLPIQTHIFKVLLLILSHCHSSLCWLWSDFFPCWIAKSPLPFEEQSNRKHLKLSVQPPWREWPFRCVVDFNTSSMKSNVPRFWVHFMCLCFISCVYSEKKNLVNL